MELQNKPGLTSGAFEEAKERISKRKAKELFEIDALDALTDRIDDRAPFMHGIDTSYGYEGYRRYRTEDL